MIRLLIVDDEEAVRNTITRMVGRYCPGVEIVGEAQDVKSGIDRVKLLRPDLLLLDIKMRDGTGFDLLEATGYENMKVTFVSAYDEFALKAIKYGAFDFILKPIDPRELKQTVKNATEFLEKDKLNNLLHMISDETNRNRRIVVKTENDIHFFYSRDILRCQSDGNYTRFYLFNGSSLLSSKTLKSYDNLLNKYGFIRVHKSHLININYAVRFDKSCGGLLYMKDNSFVPVSSRKKETLLRILDNY